VVGDRQELESALQGLEDKALVVVDTAGMGQRDLRLSEQLAMIQASLPSVKAYLVLSATTQLSGLEEIISAFSSLPLVGCIATKVDETTRLGALISVAIQKQLPLAYISDGQRVPEDLHPARAQNLVSRGVVLMHKINVDLGDEGLALAFGGMVAHASA
jgi:flagellar biosynthesis protein FlhF